MKRYATLLLVFAAWTLQAQDTTYFSTELKISILSSDFTASRKLLNDFIKQEHVVIQNQVEGKNSVDLLFSVRKSGYDQFVSVISSFGYVVSRKVNTVNNKLKVEDIKLEIAFLKSKSASYKELLTRLEVNSPKYIELWDDQKAIEDQIFNKERELLPYEQKENHYAIEVEIEDEQTAPERTKVTFVNMPGVEYTTLHIENPTKGISSSGYQGYALKYLFTKGKSFAIIGAYKAKDQIAPSDTTTFSELFNFGFGQDFYSRYLGRGSKKYFNLYSGYTIGYMLATGKKSKEDIFYLSPSVGIELFKNKYILIDTKASYFVPFSFNTEMRGLSVSASFNFVF